MATKTLSVHPCAELFPMMTGEEYTALKADIAAHGLREPIMLYGGKILDGRNRYRACCELRINPQTLAVPDAQEPSAFVVSANLHRRHLTQSQKSAVAVEVEEYLAKAAKQRQRAAGGDKKSKAAKSAEKSLPEFFPEPKSNGEARNEAAALVGVNPHYVSDAKAVKAADPTLFKQVASGEVTLPQAKKQIAPAPKQPTRPGHDAVNRWLPDVAGFLARIVNEHGDWGKLAKKEKWTKDEKLMIRGSLSALRRDLLQCERDLK